MSSNSDALQTRLTTHDGCIKLTHFSRDHLPSHQSVGRSRKLKKDAFLWRPRDRADRIYLLQQGQVALITADAEGHELIIRVINKAEAFGELCFCAQKDGLRENSARAISDCEVLEVGFDDLLKHLQDNRDALAAVVFTFCTRLADTERRLEVLSCRGAEERLARLLLLLAASDGRPNATRKEEVSLVVSHDRLAAMSAMTRPHVTVTMNKLRERGFVHYERGSQLKVNTALLAEYINKSKVVRDEDASR